MSMHEITCINCPMGCSLQVREENGKVLEVHGNSCPRGHAYGISEIEHPVRTITTSLMVNEGELEMVSCRTSQPVDKNMIFEIMNALQDITIQAPVHLGDILVKNPAGCQADLIATKTVLKKQN